MRQRMRGALAGWSAERRMDASREIARQVSERVRQMKCRRVFGFVPLRDEPDWLWHFRDDVEIALPVIHGDWIRFYRIVSGQALDRGPLGVREPVPDDANRRVPGHGDVILVPGLAFDREGRRLGRGGGYYDRFLARADASVEKIGVVFSAGIVERVPTDPWDQSVDRVVCDGASAVGGVT